MSVESRLATKLNVSYDTKQISLFKYVLLIAGFSAVGILGRSAFQWIPSVEPILPMAISLSFLKDWRKGSLVGVSSFFASNFFVWGFQGPWTIFQCAGVYVACIFSDYVSKISNKRSLFFSSLVLGTLIYELFVNVGSFLFFPWAVSIGIVYLVAAVPFGLIHIASSIGFGSIAYAFREKIRHVWEEEVLSVGAFDNSTFINSSKYKNKLLRRKSNPGNNGNKRT